MKRYILPILVLATVWYIALRPKQKADIEEVVSDPAPQRQHLPKFKPAPAAPAPSPAKTAAPQVAQVVPAEAAKPDDPHKPPKGMISFVLYKDLVVSYGDVLIGHPTTPRFPEQGYIPVPKTNEWKVREIPFSIHQDLPNPERVLKVIQYFNENTPVKFVPLKEDQNDSIVFAPSDIPLCLSYVGKIGGHQPIYLDDRCGEREIMHEVMHALGFIHEHSRPDRDQYVRVLWGNIELDKQSQFEVMPEELSQTTKGRPFDYSSVMIYGDTDFGRVRGDITLESLDRDHKVAPIEQGLSPEDLERLKIKYGGG